MKNMKASEWVKFLQDRNVNIRLDNMPNFWHGYYSAIGDEIGLKRRPSKETLFHELAHWSGHPERLNREHIQALTTNAWDAETNDVEESIAWETSKLMRKKFGGGSAGYTRWCRLLKNRNTEHTRTEGKRAFDFICQRFDLDA